MNQIETPSTPNRADAILGRLREQGRRMTTSRRAVIEVLASTNEHLTVEDIAVRVQVAHEEIHLSTVYRTLEALESWDVVEHIHRGHAPPIHHLAHTHPHLVCEACGRVYDIPPDELDHLGTRLREQYGFQLHATHFALMGRCNQHTGKDVHPA